MTDIQDPRHAVVQKIINDNWRKGSASDLATKVLAGLDDYVQPGWLAIHDSMVAEKTLLDYATWLEDMAESLADMMSNEDEDENRRTIGALRAKAERFRLDRPTPAHPGFILDIEVKKGQEYEWTQDDNTRLVRFTVTRVDSTKHWADIACTEVPTGRTWTKRQHLNKGRFPTGTYLVKESS